jgi:hypothetical protein
MPLRRRAVPKPQPHTLIVCDLHAISEANRSDSAEISRSGDVYEIQSGLIVWLGRAYAPLKEPREKQFFSMTDLGASYNECTSD